MSHDDRHDYELGQRLVEIDRELREYYLNGRTDDGLFHYKVERDVDEEEE